MPWFEYARPGITNSPRQIPVRHPLNLLEENPACGTSRTEALAFYASGAFTTWEVNARNIMQEIGGAIASQKEWALRDAIGIAYVPYNRATFNSLPPEMRYTGNGDETGASFKSSYGNDALGMLLGGDGQFAGLSTKGYYNALQGKYGSRSKGVYYFSLVVSFGVYYQYLIDTSYGATGYFHRPYNKNDQSQTPEYGHCEVTGDYYSYTFFKNQRAIYFWLNSWQPTSAELMASSGWGKWLESNRYRRVEWETPYPPAGCNYDN